MDMAVLKQALTDKVAGILIGLALANAKTLLHYAVLAVFKIAPLRAWLVGHPEEAKADLAVFVAEVNADIDALKDKPAVMP